MTTKEQERKALEQIRKIVEGLGENSYVGTAFAGCFEDAEDNIENDFAMSMKDRYESEERKCAKIKEANDVLTLKVKGLQTEKELEHVRAEENLRALDATKKELELTAQTMRQEKERADRLADRNKELAQEIIELKAKLYDMIVK